MQLRQICLLRIAHLMRQQQSLFLDLISLSYDFSVEIEKLFEDYIKENNLEQKDKKET